MLVNITIEYAITFHYNIYENDTPPTWGKTQKKLVFPCGCVHWHRCRIPRKQRKTSCCVCVYKHKLNVKFNYTYELIHLSIGEQKSYDVELKSLFSWRQKKRLKLKNFTFSDVAGCCCCFFRSIVMVCK